MMFNSRIKLLGNVVQKAFRGIGNFIIPRNPVNDIRAIVPDDKVMPFNPITYLKQEAPLDEVLKILIMPVIVLSAYWTGRAVADIWGYSTFIDVAALVIASVVITSIEVYCLRLYVIKEDLLALVFAFLLACISIWGSVAAFENGFYKNKLNVKTQQLVEKEISDLDKQIELEQKQIELFQEREWTRSAANTALRVDSLRQIRSEKIAKIETEKAGAGNAIWHSIAKMYDISVDEAAAYGNLAISLILELALIFITLRSAGEELLKREQRIIMASFLFSKATQAASVSIGREPSVRIASETSPEMLAASNTGVLPQQIAVTQNSSLDSDSKASKISAKVPLQNVLPQQPTVSNNNHSEKLEKQTNSSKDDPPEELAPNWERIADIVYDCLEAGCYEKGSVAGAFRFQNVAKKLKVSRQYVRSIFNDYWANAESRSEAMVIEIVERYLREHSDRTIDDIVRFSGLPEEYVKWVLNKKGE